MNIDRDTLVELQYQLLDAQSNVLESTEEDGPVTYLHGHGEILVGLERAIDGAEAGANVRVTLEPEDAYGEHDPDGIVAVPRTELPPDAEIVPGDCIEVCVEEEGVEETVEMVVVEIRPDAIFLDSNHPLAGQQVTFDVQIVSVRAASEEEIAQREAELAGEQEHEHGPDCDH